MFSRCIIKVIYYFDSITLMFFYYYHYFIFSQRTAEGLPVSPSLLSDCWHKHYWWRNLFFFRIQWTDCYQKSLHQYLKFATIVHNLGARLCKFSRRCIFLPSHYVKGCWRSYFWYNLTFRCLKILFLSEIKLSLVCYKMLPRTVQ